MIGAIAGDIIGSVYERHPIKTKDFPLFQPESRFTDDTVLTIAIAKAILESDSHEDAVRNAISLGGDSDTLACVTGGIAEAYYGPVAPQISKKVKELLTEDLWQITERFCRRCEIEGLKWEKP